MTGRRSDRSSSPNRRSTAASSVAMQSVRFVSAAGMVSGIAKIAERGQTLLVECQRLRAVPEILEGVRQIPLQIGHRPCIAKLPPERQARPMVLHSLRELPLQLHCDAQIVVGSRHAPVIAHLRTNGQRLGE